MRTLCLLACCFSLSIFTSAVQAQDLPDVAQGLQPYVAYHGGELDQVNTLNGGLTVRIPLVSYPQKGSLALSYSVIFNSFSFQDLSICQGTSAPTGPVDTIPIKAGCTNRIELTPTGVGSGYPLGPRLIADQELSAGGNSEPEVNGGAQAPILGRFYIIGPDNSEHPLAPTSGGYRSVDQAGYLFVPTSAPSVANNNLGNPEAAYTSDPLRTMSPAPGAITDPNGIVYTSTSITDPDANSISLPNVAYSSKFSSGLPATDSTGRPIPDVIPGNMALCPVLPEAQFQPLTSASSWTIPGPGGQVTYLFCFASVNIYTHIVIGSTSNGNSELIRTVTMLQSILLPNSTFWGFVYDSNNPSSDPTPTINNANLGTGQLMTLVYPTGGRINYTYNVGEGACNSGGRPNGLNPGGTALLAYTPQIATRAMADAQGNILGTWTYGGGTILSPDGNLTVTKFATDPTAPYQCPAFDAGQSYYEGPSASGKLLKSVAKALTFVVYPGQPYASYPQETATTTTLANGSTSSVQSGYSNSMTFSDIQCSYQGLNCGNVGSYSLPIGTPTTKKYTDFNGSTLKQETTTYEWQTNSAYLAANLLNIPAVTSVLDGSNNVTSQTSYTYDQSTNSYSPGGTRGHNTTITRTLTTSGVSPTIHIGWNASGMKTFIIDADANAGVPNHVNTLLHSIDYSYDPNPLISCNGSLVTSTVNALNQKVTGTYDCNSGLIASFTDANTQTTGVLWDSMKRLWVVTYPQIPDVGIPQTKFHYLDPTNTVTRTILGNPDPTQTLNVIFDGFGREIHRISTDDPGNDTIDTTYDSNGRVGSISNPYRSTPNGTTTYAYDGLNRKTVQTQPDGTTLISCFDGIPSTGQTNCAPNASSILGASWVDSTDETGRHWQHVSDALGRLRAVMEPDHASNVLSLQTDYTYNTLDDLVSVNQIGTSGETPHVRSFTYDSLSRLLCASNPENAENPCPLSAAAAIPANVVSYIYDPNGNVTQKTDARGTWTSYTFDGLNRVLTKAYSDPLTLPATFTYDSTSISNGIGRLASETVMNGAILISKRAPLAYDPLGHITQLSECTPANCTTTPYQVLYGYDLAGNETSSTNGLPSATFNGVTVPSVSLGMAYDETGRLSGVTSSWSDALAHPATLFQANSINSSAPAYSPAGGLENAIVGINSQTSASTATMVRAYDNRLRPLSETDTASAVLTHPATQSYGSISLAGTEQQTNGTPTQATGTITITGAEGTHAVCTNRLIAGQIVQVCNPYPDSGFLTVTINGFVAKGAYGSGSTDPTVAAALAAALNATGTPVVASSTNNVVTMTSIAAGTAANYGYSISNGTDFAGTDSGSTLIGGTAGPVIYDAGTITVTLNGTQASVPYNSASTPQSLASALGTALQSADGGVVMVSPSGSGIGLTSIQTGTAANLTLSCSVTSSVPQFSLPSFPTTCSGLTGGTNTGTSVETAYSYSIPTSGGYAGNGNLLNATDSVTGGWIYTYDNLNRLTAATGASGSYNGTIGVSGITLGWTYDSFGNRLLQSSSSANLPSYTANYSPSNNRLTSTSQAPGGVTYDNAGNVTADGVNTYLYDAEGRVCAVFSRISGYTQYLYDAEGNRVAKGSINTLSCNLSNNAFTLSKSYIYGAKGELLTEMGANGAWDHSNVYADGRLLATYRDSNTYFAFADWLGSKRAQLSAAGSLQTYGSLPFGDDLTPPAPSSTTTTDAAEQHFTGKERDAESGLDYFGARYYASSMGRFTSPDPGKINPKHLLNPQKWNKYAYVLNNPLSMIDPDGMEELWIQYRAYIPQPTVGSVRGDNRGPSTQENASSRASITMHIETDPAKNHGNPLLGFTQSVSDTHNTKGEATPPQLMQAPTASATQDSVTGQVTLNVKMDVASGDAGILQGLGIRSNVNIGVNEAGTQATVQGTVSGSPAFEANFAPQGGPTTNLPIQGASPNPVGFIVRLGGTNQVDKKTDIKQPGQPQ